MLLNLGFTEYEARVYFALIGKKYCSAAEAARISGIPRNKVYDVLKSLTAKGGCTLLKGSKKFYEPVNPTVLSRKARFKIEEEAVSLTKSIGAVENELFELYENPISENEDVDYITILADPTVQANRFFDLDKNIKKEYLCFAKEAIVATGLRRIDANLYKELQKDSMNVISQAIKERGVINYTVSTLKDVRKSAARWICEHCLDNDRVDHRIVEKVPFKAVIYDCSDLILTIRNRKNTGYSDVLFHLREPGLAEVLRNTFYTYFEQGISVKDLDLDILETEGKMVLK